VTLNSPQKWLPEIYLACGEANLDTFFKAMELLMVAQKPFDHRIRSFCYKLWKFYNTDSLGVRHRKLLESEQSAQMEKKFYHVDADTKLYRSAIDGIDLSANN
jgi:hypothetical protein